MFNHRHLRPELDEIRLVRFVCHEDSSRLSLEIKSASLNSDIHFSALSYVWGDPTDSLHIDVDGSPFSIGRNLHAGLQQLQRNGLDSWFWVDSICINQSDTEEKSNQVGHMRSIFGRAIRVYMWLGPGSDDTDEAMDFAALVGPQAVSAGVLTPWRDDALRKEAHKYLASLSSSGYGEELGDMTPMSRMVRFVLRVADESGVIVEEGSEKTRLISGIETLFLRDYWHRVWIIQEVAVSQGASVLCGEKSIALVLFDAAFSTLFQALELGIWRPVPNGQPLQRTIDLRLYDIPALDLYRLNQRDKQVRMIDVLFRYRPSPHRPSYSASDPRDIAFGLLGLLPDGKNHGMKADYSRNFVDVFCDMTRAFLESAKEGKMQFNLTWVVPREQNPDHLPSWVPDWRQVGRYSIRVWPIDTYRGFNASKGMADSPKAQSLGESSSRVLRRSGCRVDIVTEVMGPMKWTKATEWDDMQVEDPTACLASIFNFAGLPSEPGPGEDYIWRTIAKGHLLGCFPGVPRSPGVDEYVFQLVRKILRQKYVSAQELSQDQAGFITSSFASSQPVASKSLDGQLAFFVKRGITTLVNGMKGRTLFRTAKGMFGLGHGTIKPGDVVTLLRGAVSPIILRPRDEIECPEGFGFMGDAYVDGIMDGEFLQTGPALEVFEIY